MFFPTVLFIYWYNIPDNTNSQNKILIAHWCGNDNIRHGKYIILNIYLDFNLIYLFMIYLMVLSVRKLTEVQ